MPQVTEQPRAVLIAVHKRSVPSGRTAVSVSDARPTEGTTRRVPQRLRRRGTGGRSSRTDAGEGRHPEGTRRAAAVSPCLRALTAALIHPDVPRLTSAAVDAGHHGRFITELVWAW
ncbi:hypothetical protein SKAU_G00158090 [Synaphobranchus kaupii]|uniref:Uncharacterized protein n=1 Tax=Synaphobranchus kaupii TaxID=118154 RepID=A0A9Q1FHY8_SYNKA|nr:hypothetical protein SKAU_G00158090 [Synaphobranchus kaupii]